jgi:heterodisulfide reductase subunit A
LDIFPDWGISVFYIDLQTPGKMASSLIGEARAKGVRLLQGVPGEINMGPENSLEIIREEKGRNIRERYDRIILSIGQRPRPPQDPDDEIIGIRSSDTGHISTPNPIDPCRSATSGIYVAGACQGPRDIEMTIEHAGQTVAAIIQDLTMVKGA